MGHAVINYIHIYIYINHHISWQHVKCCCATIYQGGSYTTILEEQYQWITGSTSQLPDVKIRTI
jgi:hypothetical protein